MYENLIVLSPWPTYGDSLGSVSMIYFLLQFYNKIYFWLGDRDILIEYFNLFFRNDESNRIFIKNNIENFIKDNSDIDFHIINFSNGWLQPNYLDNYNNVKYYINYKNPLYNLLDIEDKYITKPNIDLKHEDLEINHLVFYRLVGLNNLVRMEYFNYFRDLDKETEVMNNIKEKFNITDNCKYNIINYPGVFDSAKWNKYIKNDP